MGGEFRVGGSVSRWSVGRLVSGVSGRWSVLDRFIKTSDENNFVADSI